MVCLLNTFLIFPCYANLNDLNFIYKQILENHPGVHNKLDPGFTQNLYKEYNAANKLLSKTTDPIQQKFIITSFVKSFDDAHLRVSWHYQEQLDKNNYSNKKYSTFNFYNINSKITWIGLPTFSLSNSQKLQFELVQKKILNLYNRSLRKLDF